VLVVIQLCMFRVYT